MLLRSKNRGTEPPPTGKRIPSGSRQFPVGGGSVPRSFIAMTSRWTSARSLHSALVLAGCSSSGCRDLTTRPVAPGEEAGDGERQEHREQVGRHSEAHHERVRVRDRREVHRHLEGTGDHGQDGAARALPTPTVARTVRQSAEERVTNPGRRTSMQRSSAG